jgi:hypothetical protein
VPTESFLVSALPHSADPAAPFHVSLYIGHRLTPDGGADGAVGDFAHVRDWTAQLAGAEITLLGHRPGQPATVIAAHVVGTTDPTLWGKVFPKRLLVQPWTTKDPTAVPWQTFPAHAMDVHARRVHEEAMVSSPVVAPAPSGLSLTDDLLRALGYPGKDWLLHGDAPQRGQGHARDNALERLLGLVGGGTEADLEERHTALLDKHNNDGPVRGRATSGPWSAAQALQDVHAARRYYQREEDAFPYRAEPVPGQKPPARPAAPPQEFHRRVGRLGDVSPLLRQLGLVLDLVVENLHDLVGLTGLSAQLLIPGLANPVVTQPVTACATTGHLFAATTSSGRWNAGMLRLGDESQFTVLELDPDASALKLEQYLRTVPRLLAVEGNGGQGSSAAPAALRATGFAIAEPDRANALRSRLADAPSRAAQVEAGNGPPLELEQITRGVRLEVWDDVSRVWHSLHRRRVSVSVAGNPVLTEAPDEAFLQGASLTSSDSNPTTAYSHEVLAGWDGWSLAAPRPEKTVVHDDGDERIVDEAHPESGAEPVDVTSLTAPGTLPRLRYGRRYAFRAYAVDLAGNSRAGTAHPTAKAGGPGALDTAAGRLLATRATTVDGSARRTPLAPVTPPPAFDLQLREGTPGLDLAALAQPGLVSQLVASRAQLAAEVRLVPDRRLAVETAFTEAVAAAPYVLERSDATTPLTTLTAAWESTLVDARGLLAAGAPLATLTPWLLDVVTVPRPFLRWAPLIEPAVVPRRAYTEGESLMRLVIRSGVDDEGTLTAPGAYADATRAAFPELAQLWEADSQRHLAPPKTSLVEAEMHGALDGAIGDTTGAAARKKGLGIALREGGTFLQPSVADLDNPGLELPVAGLSFHLGPTAEPLPGTPVPTPTTLGRGDPLLPGQYAAHDVDVLEVPYLPDPLATGLSFVFPDADPGLRLFEKTAGHLGVQSLTLTYQGDWPRLSAYRLVLVSGDRLDGTVEGNLVTITLPPGEQLRIRLSSAVESQALELFGLWRTLHASIKDVPQIAEAAADGWLWWLTPAGEMTLVHAVPRPVTAPRFTAFGVQRQPGSTTAELLGGLEVHAASTDRLDLEASWTEWHDDLAKPGPEQVTVQATACGNPVATGEPVVILAGSGTFAGTHQAIHHLSDTHHRSVAYIARATTRYREFFPLQVAGSKDELSLVSTPWTLSLPSTVRPAKVIVRDVLPLFRWSDETEAAQPFGTRRTRRAGVRLYLDRPWFSTGDGELLAVVLGTVPTAKTTAPPVSQWASDPVWQQAGPVNAAQLPLVDALHLLGLDDRKEAGRPVTGLVHSTLVDVDGKPPVVLLGYQPEYNADRRLWFVDVDLDPGASFWPFVRLAVARYQPDSLPGLELGPVALCDFAQLTPERSAVVARTHDGQVKVAVTGSVGLPRPWEQVIGRHTTLAERLAPSRTMHVRLERRIPAIGTDLGWQVESAADLPVLSNLGAFVTWEGTVSLPADVVAPERPGRQPTGDLRVVIEEEERLQADPAGPGESGQIRTSSRVVYADTFLL